MRKVAKERMTQAVDVSPSPAPEARNPARNWTRLHQQLRAMGGLGLSRHIRLTRLDNVGTAKQLASAHS